MKNKLVCTFWAVFFVIFMISCQLNNNENRTGLEEQNEIRNQTNNEENTDLIIKIDKESFLREYSLWNKKDYMFTYKYAADHGQTDSVRVMVKENKDSVLYYHEPGLVVIFKSIPEVYDFISGTFDYIEDVKNGKNKERKIKSMTLDIVYDTQYHYPKNVKFSTIQAYSGIMDGGEIGYNLKISDFSE